MNTARDDELGRSALRWALWLVGGAAFAGLVVRLFTGEPSDRGTVVGLCVCALCLAVHIAAKRALRPATWVFLALAFVAACAISTARGPTFVSMVPLYLLIALCAGLVLGARAALGFGAAACVAIAVIIVLQDRGVLVPQRPMSTVYRASSAVMVTGGIVAIFTFALVRMRRGFDEVDTARADLERTIDARTKSLVDALDAAQAAARAKSAFIANVSHELRTPLNAVVGMSDALLAGNLTREQRAHVYALRGGADALTSVVNDVLDLATVEAGGLAVESAPFEPRVVLHDVVALLTPDAQRRGLTLDARVDADVPGSALGDGRRLRQILLNLVGNALKFTEEGAVSVRVRMDLDQIAFTVQDTGPGIQPGDKERIFQPFARTDGTKPGLGLGLPIARELARRLGGTLDVESEPGQGATFRLGLPAAAAPEASGPMPPSPSLPTPLKILVAEDNELNVHVLLALLRALGQTADVAKTGAEALAAARRTKYDVVLMDVQMPEIDGVEATRRLRADLGADAPRIVGVTADARPDKVELFRVAGMSDVLHKPLHLEALAAALARAAN